MEKEKYTTKKGKESERYHIATVDDEAKKLLAGGGFLAYVRQSTGKVYAVEMQSGRKLTDEERAQRAKAKKEKAAKFYKKRLDSTNKKISEAEAFLTKLATVDVSAFPVLARQKVAAEKRLVAAKGKVAHWQSKVGA